MRLWLTMTCIICSTLTYSTPSKKALRNKLSVAQREEKNISHGLKYIEKKINQTKNSYDHLKSLINSDKKSTESTILTEQTIDDIRRRVIAHSQLNSYTPHSTYQKFLQKYYLIHINNKQKLINIKHQQTIERSRLSQQQASIIAKKIHHAKLQKEQLQISMIKNKQIIDQTKQQLKNYEEIIHHISSHQRQVSKQMSLMKKKLHWPVSGIIKTGYKEQIHQSQFKTKHTEIITHDKKIKAIHSGQVVISRFIDGFGNMVIIDHGDNYYSIYARADNISVFENELVKTNQVIGLFDSNQETHVLYFAMRHYREPIDPHIFMNKTLTH